MYTVIFSGELDQVTPADVKVTCDLAAPLNTAVHPTDICIDRIIMRPHWLEQSYMTASVSSIQPPENRVICRFDPNLSLATSYIYEQMNSLFTNTFGTKNPSLKIRYIPQTSPRQLNLRLGPGKQVIFSVGFQKFYNVDAVYNNTETTQLSIPIDPRSTMNHVLRSTHLITGPLIVPTFVYANQVWRVAAQFDLHGLTDISIPISVPIDNGQFVPLEATLHTNQLVLYISKLDRIATPLRHKRFQVLIIARLRGHLHSHQQDT
jgi:hypothetical protein